MTEDRLLCSCGHSVADSHTESWDYANQSGESGCSECPCLEPHGEYMSVRVETQMPEAEETETVQDAYRRTAQAMVARVKAESALRTASDALAEIAAVDWRGPEPQSRRIALNALNRIRGWDDA